MKNSIIQEIQPQCDDLWFKIKEAKNQQGRSNHDIAEACGIPESSVKNFFAGNTANPNVFYVAACCKYLDLSIDELMGISHANEDLQDLKDQKKDLEYLQKINEMQEETISNLRKSHGTQRALLTCLMALCMLMMLPFFRYISLDAKNPNVGFILDGHITPVGIVIIIIIIATINTIAAIIHKAINNNKKRDDTSGKTNKQ